MAAAAVALMVMAGTWACLITAIRGPMAGPGGAAVFAVFLLACAVMLTWHETTRRVLDGRWPSYALVLLATLAVLFSPALVWVLGSLASPVLYLLLGCVWIVGLRRLAADCREEPWWQLAAAVVGGVGLGVTYFLYVNSKGYGTVFSPEQTLLGTQHRDTLYHSSLAAMLGRFGVPATGLDGLVSIRYHFLSHALIGVTGRWLDVAPIHAYYLTHQILGLPLLLFSLTAASWWAWRTAGSGPGPGGLLTLLVPLLLLMTFEYWDWASYLVSESYALSLVLLLLALPLVIELHERPHSPVALVRYATLAVVGLAIVLAKNSVGALFACGVLYVAVRAHGFRPMRLAGFGAGVAAVFGVGMALTAAPGYTGQSLIGPLHFVRTYPESAWPNIWAIVLALAAAAWLWIVKRNGRRVTIELLAILALASLCCGLLLQIGSGAAYYFMNVGSWVSIVLLAGGLLLPRLAALRRQAVVMATVAVLIVVAIVVQPDKRRAAANLVALASTVEAAASAQALGGATSLAAAPVTATGVLDLFATADSIRPRIAAAVRHTPGGRMHARIVTAGTTVDAVFVPPTNSAFWHMHAVCTAQPFFVPALTALPMVLGLPPDREECPLPANTGFGYGAYPESSRSVALPDAELCEQVRSRGFTTVLVLESPDASRTLNCR